MRRLLPLAFVAFLACGGPDANAPDHPRPPYEGRAVELFDDVIEPRAVGLALEDPRTPRSDPVLRERTQIADGVARVTVKTVTARGDGVDVEYLLTVGVVQKLTEAPLPAEIVIRIGKTSSSLGIVKSLDARLGGKTFVAYVREFAGADGEPTWHFHFAPDTKEELGAVNDAIVLQSLK
ncbi:MAG TPA: cobalamin ABC transporter substrate-binding protein [Polyangiaceae bacterium]